MDDFKKLGKKDMLSRIEEASQEIQQLDKELNKAGDIVNHHFSKRPPAHPGRKHRRVFERWEKQALKKVDNLEQIKNIGLQKCEHAKKMTEIYRQVYGEKEVRQLGGGK